MKISFLLILISVLYVSSVKDNEEDEEEKSRRNVLRQLQRTHSVLRENYHFVTRQIATDVYMYRSYRTVTVLFFPVMRDVSDASFMFQAEELHMNNIGSCDAKDVIINLKHGSYPPVNPDGYKFPVGFVDPSTRESIHTIEILSNGEDVTYSIKNPKPGIWFGIVYKKWEDPRTQKVTQQGLVADCHTILYTDLQVKIEQSIEFTDCYSVINIDYATLPSIYKCITTDGPETIKLPISVYNIPASEENSTEIWVKINALSLPTENNFVISCAFDPRLIPTQTLIFQPYPSAWHYIQIEYINRNETKTVADCESYIRTDDVLETNNSLFDLMRDDKGRFFTWDYGLPTTDLLDATSFVNLTSNQITTVRFEVNQHLDVGGTLSLESSFLMGLKYYMGYKRPQKNGLLEFSTRSPFMKVVVCADIDKISIPQEDGSCKFNDEVKPALIVLNTTDSDSIYDKVYIPYPESGWWYLSLKLFCDDIVCPCFVSGDGTNYYVNTEKHSKLVDIDGLNKTREGKSDCNVTILMAISSSACVDGRCSTHGSCMLNTIGGHVMSFCQCSNGYGAWDCSDDSRMDSAAFMLGSVLLLTLSNLLFIFSIYVAIIRLYYTEAMMYLFTMVSSTFYHACDAPAQVAYCMMRGNILQFGDFYCGIMSFWVTLLAMSIINDSLRSSLQLIGAILVALFTTWNMHSFLSFALPVAAGVAILLISWIIDYKTNHRMKYSRGYYRIYLPLGIALVSVGLICYAFLQTEFNYRIVHSVWHMIIALCVVFLLPDVKRGEGLNPFMPNSNYLKIQFCKIFNRSQN